MDVQWEARRAELPLGPQSYVAEGRRFATEWAQSLGGPVDPEVVELVVSELLTNVARHTGGEGALRLEWTPPDRFRISVDDCAETMPELQDGPLLRSSGFGLRIVDELCVDWGVVAEKGAKTVWCDLPVARHPLAGARPGPSRPRPEGQPGGDGVSGGPASG